MGAGDPEVFQVTIIAGFVSGNSWFSFLSGCRNLYGASSFHAFTTRIIISCLPFCSEMPGSDFITGSTELAKSVHQKPGY